MTGYRRDAKAICVLGMHRGGTSALTGVLRELGAFLGPAEHLMVPRGDNPAGFHEHQLLTDLNDELLQALGGSWHEPPSLAAGWERAPGLDDLRARARQRLHDDFGDAPLWAWKDPRASVTLPFWRPLLPDDTRFVVCVRNPLNVARSLRARDRLDEAAGVDLWMRHTVAALTSLTAMPLLVLYDGLVNDPGGEVARIAAFLDVATTPDAVGRARAHVAGNANLRHHQARLAEACAAPAVSFAAVALYALLERTVGLQRAGALELEALRDVAGAFTGRAALAHTAERDSVALAAQVATLDARAAALAASLEAREADLVRARGEADALSERLEASASEHARLEALLRDREAETEARMHARNEEVAALLRDREAEAEARLRARNDEVEALLREREAEAAARLGASQADNAALRQAHALEVAALREAHETALTAQRTAHEAEVGALHAAHDAELATERSARDAALDMLRAAHDGEVASLRAAHAAEDAQWQARAAADAAATDVLRRELGRASGELNETATEVGRLNALLLHLQTPAGIAKLALRAVLPQGLHRRLRAWTGRQGGPPTP
ncbi:MAG: sulfotransferase [Vicinamibacterales bacterium]